MREDRHKENALNLITVYINIGLAYFYKEQYEMAKKYLNFAKEISQQEAGVNMGTILFDLARAQYKQDQNEGRYLAELHTACKYAAKEGKMSTQMQILNEQCTIRLMLGEYFFAEKILKEGEKILNNVGDTDINMVHILLKANYYKRIGNHAESLEWFEKIVHMISGKGNSIWAKAMLRELITLYDYDEKVGELAVQLCNICGIDSIELQESMKIQERYREKEHLLMPTFIMETFPSNKWRRYIIICEYFQEKTKLPALFKELCIEYLSKFDYGRLRDVSECYLAAANAEGDQIAALYYHGCACMDTQDYKKAEEMVNACMSYACSLSDKGYYDEALSCALGLLDNKIDLDLKKEVADTITQMKWLNSKIGVDFMVDRENDFPQKLANIANELFDHAVDKRQAWELMQLAKEKYEMMGDEKGVAHCENNLGNFYRAEGKMQEAVIHLEEALNLKEKIGDIQGVVSELSNIILLCTEFFDDDSAGKYVKYAVQNMEKYDFISEKYRLFFSLHLYYFKTNHLAESFHYAKFAQEGIEYLSNLAEERRMILEIVGRNISMLEKIFHPLE